MEVQLERRVLRFRAPIVTAHGRLERRELLRLVLRDEDGATGEGEAAPLEPYDGVSLDAVQAALQGCVPLLHAAGGAAREQVLGACWLQTGLPQAVAAVDLALWDMASRRAGRPLAELLAPAPAETVPVNASIGAVGPDEAETQARTAVAAGFRCLKVKVGAGGDVARVEAVRRAAGDEVLLRLDANGAWNVAEAHAALKDLIPFGLELVEEPVHGLRELGELRALGPGVPLAMDETASSAGARASGATEFVCLKIAACGGITGLLGAAETARTAGSEVYVASTYDGPAGIAAGLHAAAALGPLPACGLATLGLFDRVGDIGPLSERGEIAVPREPGLGFGSTGAAGGPANDSV